MNWSTGMEESPYTSAAIDLVDCLVEAAGTPGFVKRCKALTAIT